MNKQECRGILKEVVEGCLDGSLKHNQLYYHCGNTHCIAGWYEVEYAKEKGLRFDAETDNFVRGNWSNYYAPGFERESHAAVISRQTGYSVQSLIRLFSASNSLEDIREIWGELNE